MSLTNGEQLLGDFQDFEYQRRRNQNKLLLTNSQVLQQSVQLRIPQLRDLNNERALQRLKSCSSSSQNSPQPERLQFQYQKALENSQKSNITDLE